MMSNVWAVFDTLRMVAGERHARTLVGRGSIGLGASHQAIRRPLLLIDRRILTHRV